MEQHLLSKKIRSLAESIGIDAIGFTEASEFTGYVLNQHQRRDPKLTLRNARSIIVAGIYIGGVTMPEWKNPWYGRTSRLYLSGFFLDVVKPLAPLADFLENKGHQAIICDGLKEGGSIIPLKLAAIRAGIGWQGKHSLLISKKFGTYLVTKMTDHFQKKIEDWGDSFYLPSLSKLSEDEYKDMFGHLNTGISYDLFHRNVLIAMGRAQKLTERTNQ